eukprot:CAMPEP_0198132658 /NCGR_PEP_ID=MMETSP1442-20131203/58782_1 /TAXON_ID= /ORGANISM="Craspedostauros australis, Strain CCMP3328" /LENGTH=188 /DNA_ID=CAMNT_0043793709 /DNA_START=167 /DNA_END=734 /DNA_ORIENTATION=-
MIAEHDALREREILNLVLNEGPRKGPQRLQDALRVRQELSLGQEDAVIVHVQGRFESRRVDGIRVADDDGDATGSHGSKESVGVRCVAQQDEAELRMGEVIEPLGAVLHVKADGVGIVGQVGAIDRCMAIGRGVEEGGHGAGVVEDVELEVSNLRMLARIKGKDAELVPSPSEKQRGTDGFMTRKAAS